MTKWFLGTILAAGGSNHLIRLTFLAQEDDATVDVSTTILSGHQAEIFSVTIDPQDKFLFSSGMWFVCFNLTFTC